MARLPQKVAAAFEKVKEGYPFRVVLKSIGKGYYVYKEKGVWLKDKQRNKIISEYLGRITEEGLYIKKKLSAKDDLENAKALITEQGGEIIWHEEKGQQSETPITEQQEIKVKDTDLKILMALSMNARMPISKLAKFAGASENATYSKVKSLEEKLGINYILDIDVEKLGYYRYFILIKFENGMPKIEELRKVIIDEPRIQFAATTKGEYDMVMYIVDENPLVATDNLAELRQKEPFINYKSSWTLTYFVQVYSFMPIKESFIENVLKEHVWHRTNRTKDVSIPNRNQLKYREFILIKELNNNSACNFTDIDQKYNLNKGTARYTYHTLKENAIISPTISMTKLNIKYIGVIIIENIYYKNIKENRYRHLLDIIDYGPITNKYCLAGNVGAPKNGGISFLPVFQEGYLEKTVNNTEKNLQGSVVKSLIITEIITGTLCYRRFDNDYSRQHRLLIELNKAESKKPIIYG